ncbi:MAG: Na-translocating system protein MpsC family protein [Bacillota bacterium]
MEGIVRNLTGRSVISLHTDVSTVTGERVFIFTLDKELFPG